MLDELEAIKIVCRKRLSRGATPQNIKDYLKHLSEGPWKNSPGMQAAIKTIKIAPGKTWTVK